METEEHQICHLMAEWRRATAEGDLQAVLALMTDDAVFLTPGNPPMTREDFAAGFKGFAGRVRIQADQDVKEILATADLAYAWSHIVVVMTALDTGKQTRRAGHVLTVFRKSPTGAWLLSRDANLMAAGAPEEG